MKGADELHLEPVFLFKLFLTFTFSCLFSLWLYGFLGYPVKRPLATKETQNAFMGLLLRRFPRAAIEKESVEMNLNQSIRYETQSDFFKKKAAFGKL